MGERAVCVESVKLLLRLDGRECCDDNVARAAVVELEARDIVCDVAEQLSEEGDLEQLVEGDEFKTGLGICRDRGGRRAIRECAVCLLLDGSQLGGGVGDLGEAVG